MKTVKEHVLDELSAYLDGEAEDMDRVARHLQQCECCARRHMELSRLSHALRQLEEPAIPADFAARIMSRAEETPVRVWPLVFRPARIAMLAAACAVAVALVLFRPAGTPETRLASVPDAQRQYAAPEWTDLDWLAALEGELSAPLLDDFDAFVDLAVLAPDDETATPEETGAYFYPEEMDADEQALFDEALGAYFDESGPPA